MIYQAPARKTIDQGIWRTGVNRSSVYFSLVACLLWLLLSSGGASARTGTILEGDDFLDQVRGQINNVDTPQLARMIDEVPRLVLLDVREAAEISASGGTIDAHRVHNVSRGWIEFRVPERVPDLDTPIVVFCNLNLRSPLATGRLMEMGYTNVSNYSDGFPSWRDGGYPVNSDTAHENMLYRKPVQVSENVWSSVGATAPPSYENSGHNNNLSFIITSEGVVVVNAGDNYLLAMSLHGEIRKLTDQPVRYVVLENAQGHAMLGSSYWQEQGAQVIAHVDALQAIRDHGESRFDNMVEFRRDKAMGTRLSYPDITFEDVHVLELGGERIELLHLGEAHSPGDVTVWLPGQKLVISGDIAFNQRLPAIMEDSNTAAWVDTFDALLELDARVVIPGHGHPTDNVTISWTTRDYLVYLRSQMAALVESGGDLQDAYNVDQQAYSHLDAYFELSRVNAGRVFREMEFDF